MIVKYKGLSVDDLKEWFSVNQDGALVWAVDKSNKKAGQEAGRVKGKQKVVVVDGKTIPVSKVIYTIQNGYWPNGTVSYKDGDWKNCVASNVVFSSGETKTNNRYDLSKAPVSGEARQNGGDYHNGISKFDIQSRYKLNHDGEVSLIHDAGGKKAGDPVGTIIKGQKYIRVDGRNIKLAKVAYLLLRGYWPTETVRFIDGDPLNCRHYNLVEDSVLKNNKPINLISDNPYTPSPFEVFRRTRLCFKYEYYYTFVDSTWNLVYHFPHYEKCLWSFPDDQEIEGWTIWQDLMAKKTVPNDYEFLWESDRQHKGSGIHSVWSFESAVRVCTRENPVERLRCPVHQDEVEKAWYGDEDRFLELMKRAEAGMSTGGVTDVSDDVQATSIAGPRPAPTETPSVDPDGVCPPSIPNVHVVDFNARGLGKAT